MADYAFVTKWSFAAPVAAVWHEILHPLDWPQWWPGVENVEMIEAGDAATLGCVYRSTWKSVLPYRLTFDSRSIHIDRHGSYEIVATGQLEGRGLWSFAESGGVTHVRYDWKVAANEWWMRFFSPMMWPLFRWNHNAIMRWGGEGLANRMAR